jgi:hypothetical protein
VSATAKNVSLAIARTARIPIAPRPELRGQREGEAGVGGVGVRQIVRRVDQGHHAIRNSYVAVELMGIRQTDDFQRLAPQSVWQSNCTQRLYISTEKPVNMVRFPGTDQCLARISLGSSSFAHAAIAGASQGMCSSVLWVSQGTS